VNIDPIGWIVIAVLVLAIALVARFIIRVMRR
jgi:hypothetical protein